MSHGICYMGGELEMVYKLIFGRTLKIPDTEKLIETVNSN